MNLQDLFDKAKNSAEDCGIMKAQSLLFSIKGIEDTKFHFGIDENGHYIAIPINKDAFLPENVGPLVLVIDTDEDMSYYIDRRDLSK